MAAERFLVSGVVQMVGYRVWTQRTAGALGVAGFVRNLVDGRVEIHAEGAPALIEELAARCQRGPTHARVTNVARDPRPERGLRAFVVLDDARDPE
ncbi:MAG: acylphosphatase [Deltaproteobacteria bacterium]|nr:acylphosphatase [Deltaproteobacteria bacterium]